VKISPVAVEVIGLIEIEKKEETPAAGQAR